MPKEQKVVFSVNLSLWIYFWVAFALSSYPYERDPLGHPAGTGYTFWGHSIAVVESPFVYLFFRIMFCSSFPSFLLVSLLAQSIPPDLLNGFWGGVSGAGWLLLAVMVLSFLQWHLIGRVAKWAWQRSRGRSGGGIRHVA